MHSLFKGLDFCLMICNGLISAWYVLSRGAEAWGISVILYPVGTANEIL